MNSESAVVTAPSSIMRDQTLISPEQRFWQEHFDATHHGTIAGTENRFVVGGEYSETTFDNRRRFSNVSAGTAAALRVVALQAEAGFYGFNPALTSGAGNRTDTNSDVQVVGVSGGCLDDLPRLTLVVGLRHDRLRFSVAPRTSMQPR